MMNSNKTSIQLSQLGIIIQDEEFLKVIIKFSTSDKAFRVL